MSHSVAEITALAQKAARGAGFEPAQAERFGRAAALHLGAGRDAQALTYALDNPNDSPILRLPLLMDDVLRALALAGPDVALSLHPGDETLALAYVRLLPVRLTHCAIAAPEGDGQSRLVVHAVTSVAARPSFPARIEVPGDLMTLMTRLASRTYVPASEASRRAGAGAGDIDNE